MLEAPLADEGFATGLDLLTCGRIDRVVVIRCDLIVQGSLPHIYLLILIPAALSVVGI
jgi:hypothetical protein